MKRGNPKRKPRWSSALFLSKPITTNQWKGSGVQFAIHYLLTVKAGDARIANCTPDPRPPPDDSPLFIWSTLRFVMLREGSDDKRGD